MPYTQAFEKKHLNFRIEAIRFHDLTLSDDIKLVEKGARKVLKPIGLQTVRVLKRVINGRDKGYVFINFKTETRYYSIHKTFDRAVRKFDLTAMDSKLRFHDLRHVFATWLHRAGVSLDTIRPLCGS